MLYELHLVGTISTHYLYPTQKSHIELELYIFYLLVTNNSVITGTIPSKNISSSKQSSKKVIKQKPVDSENTSFSESWSERSEEEYDRNISTKVVQKGKAAAKAKIKNVVPQESEIPPPKESRRKNLSVSPLHSLQYINDDDEVKSISPKESSDVAQVPQVDAIPIGRHDPPV